MNYIYDGLGNRVEKANGTLYWYGPGGEVLDETNLTGSLTSEYVFFAGKRVARRDAGGNIYYYAEDFIGSSRVITQSNGTLCSDADFLPFGQEADYTSGCAQNYKFEGKERDIETGNDNFGARYYRSALGRWMSPDWSAIPAPVPYANLTNPQTLNLYAMSSDNPETFADLDGHLGGIPEPVATNPNGFGPDMEVDSGAYEDQFGNIILSAPPDPTPQQPTTPSQNPTDAQAQSQQSKGQELMNNRDVQTASYKLFADSGYGNDDTERAMWVTSKDGKYRFVRWPWSAEYHKEIWKGEPPQGAVAVVHTHPTKGGERPSPGDHDLADGKQSRSIRMPVYVLHRYGVWKAVPGEKDPVQVRDMKWVEEFKP